MPVLWAAFKALTLSFYICSEALAQPWLLKLQEVQEKLKHHHASFSQRDSLCSSKDSKDCQWHAEFSTHSEKRRKQGDGGASTKALPGKHLFFLMQCLLPEHTEKQC